MGRRIQGIMKLFPSWYWSYSQVRFSLSGPMCLKQIILIVLCSILQRLLSWHPPVVIFQRLLLLVFSSSLHTQSLHWTFKKWPRAWQLLQTLAFEHFVWNFTSTVSWSHSGKFQLNIKFYIMKKMRVDSQCQMPYTR